MTAKEKNKIRKQLKDSIIDFMESDNLIIDQIIDYLMIDAHAKNQLATETENGAMQWTTVSAIAIATKNISMLFGQLGVTPKDRTKLKALLKVDNSNKDNLNKYLND